MNQILSTEERKHTHSKQDIVIDHVLESIMLFNQNKLFVLISYYTVINQGTLNFYPLFFCIAVGFVSLAPEPIAKIYKYL